MQNKINELSPKQLNLLRLVAGGMAVSDVARETGYCIEQVSRIHRSERGRAEIARLTAQAEEVLAQALPELVEAALRVMKAQLRSHSEETQFRAAREVLKLARPFVKKLAENDNAEDGVIIVENGIITNAQEGRTHEDAHDTAPY